MKYRKQFDAWWRPLTLQGDPMHRANLVGDAFEGGYEAGRREALKILCEDIESGNYRPSAFALGEINDA